jgi:hypothetical protein
MLTRPELYIIKSFNPARTTQFTIWTAFEERHRCIHHGFNQIQDGWARRSRFSCRQIAPSARTAQPLDGPAAKDIKDRTSRTDIKDMHGGAGWGCAPRAWPRRKLLRQ